MKTIGLLGGMSWESSAAYYKTINEEVVRRLGGLHSARCIMYSFNFHEIEILQSAGAWDAATQKMIEGARSVELAGADLLLICTNTMHMMADEVQASIDIPVLHIADATAMRVREFGLQRIGLLGTRFTMEMDFYAGRLRDRHGIDVVVPNRNDREIVDRIIYEELCRGIIRDSSRSTYGGIIERLVGEGAQGVILGCTEISLLVSQVDSPVPVFDTTRIHAEAGVDLALSEHRFEASSEPKRRTGVDGVGRPHI